MLFKLSNGRTCNLIGFVDLWLLNDVITYKKKNTDSRAPLVGWLESMLYYRIILNYIPLLQVRMCSR